MLSGGKPRDAAAVLFGLKFADNINYKFKTLAKLRKPGFRSPNIPAERLIVFRNTVRNGPSRSSKVVDLAPIESAYATSYWSSIVT